MSMPTSMPDKPAAAESAPRSAEFDLRSLVWTLWKQRWLIIGMALAFLLVAIVYLVFAPLQYTAKVTMLPQQQNANLGVLGQLAGLSGTNLGSSGSNEELYAKIVMSDRILDLVLQKKWKYRDAEQPLTVFEIFDAEYPADDEAARRRAAFKVKKRLREKVLAFSRERLTGYMTLRVTIPKDPTLAAALANFLADALDEYNRDFQVEKATEQRTFIEGRLQQVEQNLHASEANLTRFMQNNRAYQTSPTLMQQHGELQREVSAQTSIWVELRRQLELAKIDENKELVSIFILDDASVPVKPSAPRRLLISCLALFFGGAFAVLLVLVREQLWSEKGRNLA